jgi:hypothetical protein
MPRAAGNPKRARDFTTVTLQVNGSSRGSIVDRAALLRFSTLARNLLDDDIHCLPLQDTHYEESTVAVLALWLEHHQDPTVRQTRVTFPLSGGALADVFEPWDLAFIEKHLVPGGVMTNHAALYHLIGLATYLDIRILHETCCAYFAWQVECATRDWQWRVRPPNATTLTNAPTPTAVVRSWFGLEGDYSAAEADELMEQYRWCRALDYNSVEQVSFDAHAFAASAVGNPAPLRGGVVPHRVFFFVVNDAVHYVPRPMGDSSLLRLGVGSSVELQDVLARVAVVAQAQRKHGGLPVPRLAETLLSLASARSIIVAPTRESEAAAARFLRHAPVNVRDIDQLSGDALEAFVEEPCHWLRWLAVSGAACVRAVAAVQPSLQSLTLTDSMHVMLDLSGLSQLETLDVHGCFLLTEVRLPPSLTAVGDGAFSGCVALERIDLSHTQLQSAGDGLLKGCTALTEVRLPPSLKQLGDFAIRGCIALTQIDLSQTQLESANAGLLYNCTSLTEVLLPASLKVLGDDAFSGCTALERLDLSHTQLESAGRELFFGCTSLREVTMPPSLKVLGDHAFSGCVALKRLDLSHTKLESAGEGLIDGTSLTEVKMPPSFEIKLGQRR